MTSLEERQLLPACLLASVAKAKAEKATEAEWQKDAAVSAQQLQQRYTAVPAPYYDQPLSPLRHTVPQLAQT